MKIVIFGKSFTQDFHKYIHELCIRLRQENVQVILYKPFYDLIARQTKIDLHGFNSFTRHDELDDSIDFLISVGGDGTFLESVYMVRNKNIPIVGINSGRLGFLSDIAKEEISGAIHAVLEGRYMLEERSLLKLESTQPVFQDFNYALNEVTLRKRDTSSMITIHTFVNGSLLNSYWADGLIVSTPTGSTAYAMSVGGPIVLPWAKNFIIAPIASHNLTVRPIVLPDDQEITLRFEGREGNFMVSMDSRYELISPNIELKLSKADFSIKVLKLSGHDYFITLRNKLLWGLDKRN